LATDPTADVVRVATWFAAALALWLAVGVGAALAAHLRGRAATLARLVLAGYPPALRRLVTLTAGAVLGVGAMAPAGLADDRPVRPPVVATATPPVEPLDWPTANTSRQPTPRSDAGRPVLVRTGDTLWSIAAAALSRGGRTPDATVVSASWPRWWAANRATVGADPNVISPGTVLIPPPHDALQNERSSR